MQKRVSGVRVIRVSLFLPIEGIRNGHEGMRSRIGKIVISCTGWWVEQDNWRDYYLTGEDERGR